MTSFKIGDKVKVIGGCGIEPNKCSECPVSKTGDLIVTYLYDDNSGVKLKNSITGYQCGFVLKCVKSAKIENWRKRIT